MKYLGSIRGILERASARETAVRVAAGALAKQLLAPFGITAFGYVVELGGVAVEPVPGTLAEQRDRRDQSELYTLDPAQDDGLKKMIDQCGDDGDTLGGPIATGLPPREVVLFHGGPTGVPPGPATLTFSVAPNPFSNEMRVALTAVGNDPVAVSIHDVRGRLVRHVTRAASGSGSGPASLVWDGRDEAGSGVPAGVYFVVARAGTTGPVTSKRVARVQ